MPSENIESKVAKLEVAVEGIHADVQSIKASIGTIAQNARPQWSLYVSMGGLVLAFMVTIVGGVGSGYVRDLSTLQEEFLEHIKIQGHMPMMVRVGALEKGRKESEENLKEDIILQNTNLQTEMRLRHDLQDEKIKELKEQLDRLRSGN